MSPAYCSRLVSILDVYRHVGISMQTAGNLDNVLTAKAKARFSVQHRVPLCNQFLIAIARNLHQPFIN